MASHIMLRHVPSSGMNEPQQPSRLQGLGGLPPEIAMLFRTGERAQVVSRKLQEFRGVVILAREGAASQAARSTERVL